MEGSDSDNMDSLIQDSFTVINLCKALTAVNMDSLIQEVIDKSVRDLWQLLTRIPPFRSFTVDKSVRGSDSC